MHVVFNSNGGTSVATQVIYPGEQATQPNNPTKAQYYFSGWYESGANEPFDFNTEISEDTTIYAKWNCTGGYELSSDGQKCEKRYTATFDTSGVGVNGTITKSCTIYDNMQSCTVIAPNITGYIILGRSRDPSSSTPERVIGDTISLTGDMTYYAITSPAIEFTGSTPANHTTQVENYFTSQIDITTSNLSGFSSVLDGNETSLYDDSLALMYNFDNVESLGESGTIVKDLSKNGYDGTVYGATWTGNGVHGGAYSFDGIDDYIEFPDYGPLDQNGTLSIWFNGDYKVDGILFGNYNGLTIGFWHYKIIGVTMPQYNELGQVTGYKESSWNHIVVTINGGLINYYLNGIKLNNYTEQNNRTRGTGNGTIGIRNTNRANQYPFSGQIDEIRVYNRALSQEEIETLYHSNLSKTALNKWTYTIGYTGLAGGIHTYEGIMSDILSGNKSVSRAINICTTGYHTEDGTTCVENTKTVTCDYSRVPEHANYTTGDVEITWSGTWNTGEWPQVESCPWSCENGYTKSPDGQSCLSNVLPYTVNHYQENTGNNGYTLFETENKTGLYDSLTQATSKTYQGFITQTIEQQIIQGNDTHVDIYYDRNIYTINIDLNGGTGPTSFTGKYGDTVVPPEITKSGYSIKKRVPALPETMPLNGFSSKPVRVLTDGSISISVNPNKNTLDLSIRGTSNSSRKLTGAFTNDYFTISDTKGEENGYHATLSIGNLVGNDNVNHIIPASNVQVKTDGIVRLSGAPMSEVGLVPNITNWTNVAGQTTYFTRGNIEIDDECKPGEYGINLNLKISIPSHTIPDEYHGTITYTLYED